MEYYNALFLIAINLLHGAFLAVFGTRELIRNREEYDQKFNGLTYLVRGTALILISLFLYYLLTNGLNGLNIVCAMVLGSALSSYREIGELVNSLFRGVVESRADILIRINNEKWRQLEASKLEYATAIKERSPEFLHR